MTPEQAILFLKQALVLKPGLSIDDAAALVTAWNIVATAIAMKKPEPPAPAPSDE